ncbi:MAG: PIN domain-containing protein [Acidimicrobiales bacterium]
MPLRLGATDRSWAAVAETGRSHRRHVADLLTAATAHANGLALNTRNPDDFAGPSDLVHVVGI